jgi:competence protein ComEC
VITLILKKNLCKKKVIILSILCILLSISTIKLQTHSEFIIFDVQNADCMLYKTTKNKYFIIDTGKMGFKGHKNQIKYILEEYLKDNGIKNIEGLILTHFDSDHAGGASDLIQDFNIKNIYVNSKTNTSQIAKNIYKSKVPIIKAKNNETIYSEKSIEIKTFIGNFSDKENENSIITLINDNGYKILLMGDAGIIAFNKIEKDLPKEIDIFKVGHHGAKNVVNEEMINRLQPKYSIISTGINKFGHPNPITLNILSPTNILRTDYNNAIMIKNKKVYCYDSNENKFKVY